LLDPGYQSHPATVVCLLSLLGLDFVKPRDREYATGTCESFTFQYLNLDVHMSSKSAITICLFASEAEIFILQKVMCR